MEGIESGEEGESSSSSAGEVGEGDGRAMLIRMRPGGRGMPFLIGEVGTMIHLECCGVDAGGVCGGSRRRAN